MSRLEKKTLPFEPNPAFTDVSVRTDCMVSIKRNQIDSYIIYISIYIYLRKLIKYKYRFTKIFH